MMRADGNLLCIPIANESRLDRRKIQIFRCFDQMTAAPFELRTRALYQSPHRRQQPPQFFFPIPHSFTEYCHHGFTISTSFAAR
jgi:hypothetical protein